MKRPVQNFGLMRWGDLAVLCAVLLASTVFPRLMLLGGLPATDEGVYAYQAQLIHQSLAAHRGLPDTGTLTFYPALVSWVFAQPTNPMIMLRLIDLCIAVWAAFLLYRVLSKESGSNTAAALITLVFMFTMNQLLFIQYGFKNSIAAALVPLLLAMRIGQEARSSSLLAWWAAGALTAVAVLLRETFVPFAALGLCTVLVAHGRRPSLWFAMGGILTGTLIVGVAILSRGGVVELIAAYRDAGTVYASIAHQSRTHFISNGMATVNEAVAAASLGATAAVAMVAVALRYRGRGVAMRLAFWFLVATLPLIEPASKIGFPYHFAVCLVGMSGLCALAWREAVQMSAGVKWLAGAAAAVALVSLVGKAGALWGMWPGTRDAIAAAPSGAWPADAVTRSNYLLAADAIKKFVPANGTVSVSGFMFALYPLTGHFPPSPALANLSATLIQMNLSPDRLRDALLRCPPDVIMTTTRTDWAGSTELLAAVMSTGLYEEVATVAVSGERAYGNFGGTIFRSRVSRPCAAPSEGVAAAMKLGRSN